ncbi:hypothetical protein [Spirillospora sp. NPDC048819]
MGYKLSWTCSSASANVVVRYCVRFRRTASAANVGLIYTTPSSTA